MSYIGHSNKVVISLQSERAGEQVDISNVAIAIQEGQNHYPQECRKIRRQRIKDKKERK